MADPSTNPDRPTRRAVLAAPLALGLAPPRAEAPPGWPTEADQLRMAEDCRLVAIAESFGPPVPDGVTGRLALDVVRFLKAHRARLRTPEARP